MHQRAVRFTDIFNFRDLGGYPTADGRVTKWRRLYRSDDLSRLVAADHAGLVALGIRTVIDLRRPDELARHGALPSIDSIDYHHLHVVHPPWEPRSFDTTEERQAYLVERYAEMAVCGGSAIGAALRLIADADRAPLVFHCLAGKDRTGIVAALTLSLLGVDDSTIGADYELSERAEPGQWEYFSRLNPEMLSKRWLTFTVSPAGAIRAFLQDLRDKHGSIAQYAESVGVTAAHVAAMRAHLLADPAPGAAGEAGIPAQPPAAEAGQTTSGNRADGVRLSEEALDPPVRVFGPAALDVDQ